MKKIISVLTLATIFVSLSFAVIHPRYRKVEFGGDAKFSFSQNLFSIEEIFTETLKIDFPKMHNQLNGGDFTIRTNNDVNLFFNVDVGLFSVGLEWDALNLGGKFILSNDIFKFLSEGNVLDEKMKFSIGMGLDAFSTYSLPVGVNLGRIKFVAKPSIFIPLFYMPDPEAGFEYYVDSQSGETSAKLFLNTSIYTVFNPKFSFADGLKNIDFSRIISDYGTYFNAVGFDIGGSVEYEWDETLDLGGYINMPVIPGRLNYCISALMEKNISVPSAAQLITGEGISEDIFGGDLFDESETTFGPAKTYKINRPLRFGAEASWRPFGNWWALRPSLGLAFRNPFSKDFRKGDFYVEYALNVDMRVLYVFCFNLTSAYLEQNFVQELGIGFNFKVMEIDFNIASSSPSFAKSFGLGGVLGKVTLKMGF